MNLTQPDHHASCAALTLPPELPVMVLSGCYLFPGCFLPLFIFEQRYREMLEHVLSTNRMFCIGSREIRDSDEVLPITTAGVVHSCVRHADGTAHLILMGLRRVRITGWAQNEPFRIAQVEPISSAPAPTPVLEQLRIEALNLLPPCPTEAADAIQTLSAELRQCADAELVCDILTYHFVNHAATLRSALMERCVAKRYEMLINALKAMQ